MKLIVFGANGRQGSRLASEALARRHEVTAAVHDTARAGNVDPRTSRQTRSSRRVSGPGAAPDRR
jgi:putative NADH-flavin reductase